MSCCAPGAEALAGLESKAGALPSREELLLASRVVADGQREVRLSVPTIHCGGCLRTIERALGKLDGVTGVRANLTTKSVTVRWREGTAPPAIGERLDAIGHAPHLADNAAGGTDRTFDELVRALAVAGFGSANIMAFSVSVWSGAGEGFRDLFHLLSAVIALPVLLYSGRVFYRSAWAALRHGHTNMDVPITIGVGLAFAMSFYDMAHGGPHAYFDAAVMLLFFLLIGRTLDHVMRAKARSAVADLAKLTAHGATIERGDGSRAYLPVGEIEPGMTLLIAAGERIPVDGRVLSGASELDRSLVTGESAPVAISAGAPVEAGTLNLTAPLRLEATAKAEESFLAEMVRLMTAAEAGRSGYRRLADRAAGLYAPVVHGAALVAFLGWAFATGDYHRAATIAVAVLIITCPCALGLAVPIVQVIAARRLLERGIMVRDGAGLERLAEADTVVFDKTGTLTTGRPELADADHADPDALSLAAALAAHSRHPQSLALVAAHAARDGTIAYGITPTANPQGAGQSHMEIWRDLRGCLPPPLIPPHEGNAGTAFSAEIARIRRSTEIRHRSPPPCGLGVGVISHAIGLPQGERCDASAEHRISTISTGKAAPSSPSPLWGGIKDGGEQPREPDTPSRGVYPAARDGAKVPVTDIREIPGQGLEARADGAVIRLGRADWALGGPAAVPTPVRSPCSVLSRDGRLVAAFAFHERLRPGAMEAIAALRDRGLGVEILSGDHEAPVRDLACGLGVDRFEAAVRPENKLARLKALAQEGRRTFMVGDGLNDAPALAAAHVSMAPSSAVDVGRNAADFVFMRDSLEAVPFAFTIARRARRLVRENFALAVLYNAVALPFAIAGFVTPLAAALAMSGSSLVVVANAMRLNGRASRTGKKAGRASSPTAPSSAAVTQPAE